MALTQTDAYEPFWRAHRDNWKPVTPADVWGLREDRTFQPPSRAHLKRIGRVRPVVIAARHSVSTPDAARQGVNARVAAGKGVLAACGCLPKPHATIPSNYVRPLPMPDGPRLAVDHAERRRACILAECIRIAAYGSDELSRAWRLWQTR